MSKTKIQAYCIAVMDLRQHNFLFSEYGLYWVARYPTCTPVVQSATDLQVIKTQSEYDCIWYSSES